MMHDTVIPLSEFARLLVGPWHSDTHPGTFVRIAPQDNLDDGQWQIRPEYPGLHLPLEDVRQLIPALEAAAAHLEEEE